MRTALFDHVQHQPLSFFTRTQTGSLMSRMNNDVIGAQQAVTNTLGTVFSNIVSVIVTVTFMLALEWRLTLLTLVILPLFIIPAKRMGPKLQRLTRESMQLNASMNNTIAERFNVGGALVVKLFGKHEPRVADVHRPRRPRARHRRADGDVLAHPRSSRSGSSPPSAPRSSTSSAATWRSRARSASAPSPRSPST